MLFFSSIPAILWKISDFFIIMVCYHIFAKLSGEYIETALLFCIYPFMHMASAGWIATTTIYLWPFTAALVSFYLLILVNVNEISILDKICICIVSTLQHFTSIPNIPFILFALLLAYHILINTKQCWKIIIGIIPMVISICVTCYYFITNVILQRNINYLLPEVTLNTRDREYWVQLVLVILSIIYLASVLCSLVFIYNSKKQGVRQVGIYLGGLISRFTLVFSPTMLASGTRIYFFFYMAILWLENDLIKKIKEQKIIRLIQFILVIGIIINLCMVFIMQVKYSPL